MSGELPVQEQEIQQVTLQEYADANCNGDRFRAIYELTLNSGEGGFDPYVDELTEDEANFVVALLTLDGFRIYGKDGFYQMIKTNQLAASLGTTVEEVQAQEKNPHAKGFLWGIGLVVGAIALSVLLAVLPTDNGADLAATGGSVAVGLASMNFATKLLSFLKYNKLRKMVAKLPDVDPEHANKEPESFEEAMAFYKETMQ